MRILFVSTPGHGHLQPLLGLALAARRHGDQIAVATGADPAPLLVSLGIEHHEIGAPFSTYLAELRRQCPELPPGRDHARQAFPRLFAGIAAPAMHVALERCVVQWQPDLIVAEPAALAAPLVARRHHIPLLAHDFGMPVPTQLLQAAAQLLEPAWQEAGLAVPDDAGIYADLAVEIVPEAMRAHGPVAPRAPRRLAQRPASANAVPDAPLPAPLQRFLHAAADRPLLCVGFGTLNAGGTAWQTLLQALRRHAVSAVITTGPLAGLPRGCPPRWHVEPYVPYAALLPHTDAVISHGGAGMSLAAAALGLPQLCLPQGADHFRNADALAGCGAARVLEGVLQQADLDRAIEQLTSDAALRDGARRLQAEFSARPTPADTADALASLLGQR